MKLHSLPTRSIGAVSLGLAAAALLSFTPPLDALERLNLDTSGSEVDDGVSFNPSVSADGRYVVFESNASLVPEKTSFFFDIYLRDRVLGTTTRISVDGAGNEADGSSGSPVISANGQFVAFVSNASDLVNDDTNDEGDIFVKNLLTGAVERVSVATGGAEATVWPSSDPSISGDGRYVVFSSAADDLVAGDMNNHTDIFLRDRQTGTTTRVSLGPAGAEGDGESYSPVISDDGSTVAFRSYATTLTNPATSGNAHIFVRDLGTNTTSLVSKTSGGDEADFDCDFPDLSSDGRYVVFQSSASNLDPLDTEFNTDIFLHDRQAGTTALVSVSSDGAKGNQTSWNPAISGNGTHLGFTSDSTNLVPGDSNGLTDLFVRNLTSGVTHRLSVGPNGEEADDGTWSTPDFIADGSALVFESSAGNLVPGDTNLTHDIFYGSSTPPVDTTAQKAVLEQQIKTATKKLKAAIRSGNKAKIKRYKKQVRKLKAKLRSL
jgi:Tol biopolymer transport system component